MDTTNQLVGRTLDLGDYTVPSVTQSLIFWRKVFSKEIPEYTWIPGIYRTAGWEWGKNSYWEFMETTKRLYKSGVCGICDGAGQREDDKYGHYYCLCFLLQINYSGLCRTWGSEWTKQSVDELVQPLGDPAKQGKDIALWKSAIARTRQWISTPDRWLVYSGGTGTGKTHMLNSIMAAWYPYAMYVVASEFETRLRAYLSEGGEKINQYIDALSLHPILVFDDLGIEYSSEWILAKLDALIEYRSRKSHWWDRLTVVGTNIAQIAIKDKFFRDGVSRIGSRLTDNEIVDWVPLISRDYRNKAR